MFDPADLKRLTICLLNHFQRDGYKSVVLSSGHGPNITEFLRPAVAEYRAGGGTMRVLAFVEVQIAGLPLDHAAQYETSYMLYLHPDLVDLSQLAGHDQDRSPAHEKRNWMGDQFKSHPCYGLAGPDPRGNSTPAEGRKFIDTLIENLARWVKGEEIHLAW